MDDSELYRSLCEILGARGVRDSAALAGQDPGYHPQNLAGSFLVLPESTDQVAAVVRLCRQAGRAWYPRADSPAWSAAAPRKPATCCSRCAG